MVEKNKEKEIINKQLETAGESSISAQELQLKPKEVLSLIVSQKSKYKGGIVENWEREIEQEIYKKAEEKEYEHIIVGYSLYWKNQEKWKEENREKWEAAVKLEILEKEWEKGRFLLINNPFKKFKVISIINFAGKYTDEEEKEMTRLGKKDYSKEELAEINEHWKKFISKENKETKEIIRQVESKHGGGSEEYEKRTADLAQLAILKVEEREKKYMENEEAFLKEKENKEAEIARLETKLDEYKKIEQEKKDRIIERLKKGQTIKSQEAITIEELKGENEKLIEEIGQLEIDRDDLLSLKSGYDLEINDLNLQLKGKDKRLKDWEEAYLKWDAERKEQNQKIFDLTKEGQGKDTEIRARDRTINNLNQEKNQLKTAKEATEKERDKAVRKGRLTALGNVVQGTLDYIPGLPKAWKSLSKSSIQAGSVALMIYDLPNWSYELIIILFALICWYVARDIYYRIINRKEINQVQELQGELLEMRSKYLVLKEEIKESVKNFSPKSKRSKEKQPT